ncbi:uncharacterized protein [Tenebrio molitor]|uniref:uncharacterized protein n=2 Tax=Tenebrio molitor TaxID=7067 RepID=UPI0036247C6C
MNFAIAPARIPQEEIITEVETAIRHLPKEEAEEIRFETCRILKKSKPPKRNLSRDEMKALSELRKDKDIVILRADKGNITVIMDQNEYNDKISQLLDPEHYTKLKKDPTPTIERRTREIIKQSSIPQREQRALLPSSTRPPRLYGLPKIHKEECPLRPIVSTMGSPTYNLAKYLAKHLQTYVGHTDSFVKNSLHFVESIRNVRLDTTDILVSFDVVSLFTNVPVEDSVEIIKQSLITQGLREDIPELVRFCLTSTYFLWKGNYYEQKEGAAMGSPLSPVIANLFMETFEQEALELAPLKPKLWKRYVDDTFVVWPHGRESLDQFLNHLNSLHSSIKFTMEIEENNQIPFLDVLVTRDKNQLRHTVYRKKTHSDRYLNAQSHHHPQQKRALMKTLFHRAETICDEDSKERELKHIKWALKCNGFSDRDIRFARKVRQHTEQQTYQKFACLPYVQGVTDRIRKILEKRNIGTRFTTEKKISQILPTPKDKLPLFQSEGIYKVECLCGKCYIGQTGRSIQCRLKEHSRAIKQYDKEKSALAEHKFEDGDHTFDLEKTVVLAKTSKYHQRLIREAIEIRKNPNNFNRDQGVELSSTWNSVIRPCTHPPTNFSHRATPTTPTTNPTGTTPTTNHINSPTRNRPHQFIYKLRRR